MRTNVTFQHPAEFVQVSDEDGVLAVEGAQWSVSLLRRIPDLQVRGELCQEDWGVVVFAERNRQKFWIGLSMWPDGEQAWLAHFHQASFAWLQRLGASGKSGLQRLVSDVHSVLKNEPAVSRIVWYEQSQLTKLQPDGFATPV